MVSGIVVRCRSDNLLQIELGLYKTGQEIDYEKQKR